MSDWPEPENQSARRRRANRRTWTLAELDHDRSKVYLLYFDVDAHRWSIQEQAADVDTGPGGWHRL